MSRDNGRRRVALDALQTQLWPGPVLAVVLAVGLGVGLPSLDDVVDSHLHAGFLFGGDAEGARTVLGSIASGLITATSLTFSITVVTLQLASSQFSPRLLRLFSRDRLVHVTLGLFLATFAYSLTVLRAVHGASGGRTALVPQIAVLVAFVLAVASVVLLVVFLAHLARQLRVETMLRDAHAEATATLRRTLPGQKGGSSNPAPEPPASAAPLPATASGFLIGLDGDELVEAARQADAVVAIAVLVGDSLIEGVPWAVGWSVGGEELGPHLAQRLAAGAVIGYERTPAQDVRYGLRQLVDVTCKAMSPSLNDPTTAVRALGHISALLCELAPRDLRPQVLSDSNGVARVVVPQPSFTDLVELALGQPRLYGAQDAVVIRRMLALLREVAWCATAAEQRAAVADQLARLQEASRLTDATERVLARADAALVLDALAGRWRHSPGR